MFVTIDFETRSPVDIKKSGAWLYSRHYATEVLCLAYRFLGDAEEKLWNPTIRNPLTLEEVMPATPPPLDLFRHIESGGLVDAHNAFFEICIWNNIMVPRFGWPEVRIEQWRCTASRCNYAALPRSLEEAAKAMNLPVDKDMEGRKLMLKMCKPRKPRASEKRDHAILGKAFLYHQDKNDLLRLFEYCKRDVRAQYELAKVLPELPPEELTIWQIDLKINLRGLRFDLEMARSALEMADAWKEKLNKELYELTGIDSASQRQAVANWLRKEESLDMPGTSASTVKEFLDREDVSLRARRILKIVGSYNKTSTAKYAAILDKCDPEDGCFRDLIMYHGASTGRWAGKGIQIQNFPSRNVPEKDFDYAAQVVLSKDVDYAHALYGDVMTFLSGALRASIIPRDGKVFAVADYSSIEARCLAWLANCIKALNIFKADQDIYSDMASVIYSRTITKKDKAERQLGKMAILGLGYGMGFVTFLLNLRTYDIRFTERQVLEIMGLADYEAYRQSVVESLELGGRRSTPKDKASVQNPEEAEETWADTQKRRLLKAFENPLTIIHELALTRYIVDKYRQTYVEIASFWTDQNSAAIDAVMGWRRGVIKEFGLRKFSDATDEQRGSVNGPVVTCGRISWQVVEDFLLCILPSGRPMRYRKPNVHMMKGPWGNADFRLSYQSVNGLTRKFETTYTYGGKIVENIAQGTARDIMAYAMMRVDATGIYDLCLSVHDELGAEVNADLADIKEYEELLCHLPDWAKGCPIAAEGEVMARYRK